MEKNLGFSLYLPPFGDFNCLDSSRIQKVRELGKCSFLGTYKPELGTVGNDQEATGK